ncbi:MAG: hypothetical protein LBD73_03595 [Deferribacteraceae bacterium]|jgi:hypothetical protein|nr:hypothetical protein [Deferribacteraceae bacterium]
MNACLNSAPIVLNEALSDEVKRAESAEDTKYEKLLKDGGWSALCLRVKECIEYYEQLALNGETKRSDRINALERIASMREVIGFPKSFCFNSSRH